MRTYNRTQDQLRPTKITRHYTKHAEGSVLIEYGDTKVICTASVLSSVPRFLKGSGQGWITAEYGMLPRATHDRSDREVIHGKQSGRSQEIQRLVGRSLRTVVDLKALGEYTITMDCDVIQADGGTRTAAITGGCVALVDALAHLQQQGMLAKNPLQCLVASVSVGICQGIPLLDLDYQEDSSAETDMNVVMNAHGDFVEIQGTAEKRAFQQNELSAMLELAKVGVSQLITIQQQALSIT